MSKAMKLIRGLRVSEAGPRFLLFLKRRGRLRSLDQPAKDSSAMEVVMLIVSCLMLFAIAVLVLHVLRNR
jgi:hypothetical protein